MPIGLVESDTAKSLPIYAERVVTWKEALYKREPEWDCELFTGERETLAWVFSPSALLRWFM